MNKVVWSSDLSRMKLNGSRLECADLYSLSELDREGGKYVKIGRNDASPWTIFWAQCSEGCERSTLFSVLHHDCLVRIVKRTNIFIFSLFVPCMLTVRLDHSDAVKSFAVCCNRTIQLSISNSRRMHRRDAYTLDTTRTWPMSFDCLGWIIYRSPCTDNGCEKWCFCVAFLWALFWSLQGMVRVWFDCIASTDPYS